MNHKQIIFWNLILHCDNFFVSSGNSGVSVTTIVLQIFHNNSVVLSEVKYNIVEEL
jgi:hypothetical protein